MLNGWIKLHRKLEEWEWYQDSQMVHLFIHLLINASGKDRRWQGVEIKVGQMIAGRKKLSAITGISEQSIRTCLKRLEDSGEIKRTVLTKRFTIVTICNYTDYQDRNTEINQASTKRQPSDNQAVTKHQPQCKKGRKGEREKTTTVAEAEKIKKLKPDYFSLDQWRELYVHRTKKKASQTERAYKLMLREFDKAHDAGYSASSILDAMSGGRGWASFKFEWLKNLEIKNKKEKWI